MRTPIMPRTIYVEHEPSLGFIVTTTPTKHDADDVSDEQAAEAPPRPSKPVCSFWGELLFADLPALTGFLSKHDYRVARFNSNEWRLPA